MKRKNFVLSLVMVFLLICGAAFVVTAADEKAAEPQATEQKAAEPQPAEQPQPAEPQAAEQKAPEAQAGGKIDIEALGYEGGVPAEITLKSELWKEHTKGAVALTHTKHTLDHGVTCDQCHHVYKDGKNIWKPGDPVQKCHECHTEATIKGEKKLTPEQQKLNLKLAFHENCQGCHKDVKKEKPDTKAPVTCVECHGKE